MTHGVLHSGFDVRTHSGSTTTVSITGALDGTITPILDRTLQDLDLENVARLQLDLRQLETVDAEGLRLIQALIDRCRRVGRQLHITPEQPAIAWIDHQVDRDEPEDSVDRIETW